VRGVLILASIGGIIYSITVLTDSKNSGGDVFCTNGESLNPMEQMWCSPKEKSTVSIRKDSRVNIYRVKKNNLPGKIERQSPLIQQVNRVSRYHEDHYSFVLNPGSYVTANLTSESSTVDCMLLNYDNIVKLTNGDPYTRILAGKGSLKVVNYTPSVSDEYFFVFGHTASSGKSQPEVAYSMQFTFNVFDPSKMTPECVSSSSCSVKNVGSDEMVIADNPELKQECDVFMKLPSDAHLKHVLLYSGIIAGCCVVIVLVFVSFCWSSIRESCCSFKTSLAVNEASTLLPAPTAGNDVPVAYSTAAGDDVPVATPTPY